MSYRITMNGELFCSSQIENTAILDPKVSLEVNKAGSLTFTILPDHPCYDTIEIRHSIFDVYQNDELIFEGIPVSEDIDFYNRKTVTCEGELTFLNDTVQRQAVYKNQTVRSILAAYLSVHNAEADSDREFSLGSVTVDGGDAIYRYTNFTNTMTEIGEDLIDNFGGYLRVRHADGIRYLDYLAESPRTSTQEIRIGKNLIDLAKNLSTLNVITVLIPLGAKIEGESDVEGLDKRVNISSVNSGRDYIIADSVAYYGSIWGTVTWDGVSTPEALKTKAQEYLVDGQWSNLVISASAIDLGLTDEDVEQFRILDMIRVISEPHGINRLFMLTKLDIDLNHPGDTQITLGQEQTLSLSARSVKNTTSIEMAETRIMTNASENAKQILDSSTDGNIYFRFNDLGKVYEIDFLDSEDPETATKMWRWNIGGWGYSSDGGETYKVAATMDGSIVADFITTGTLSADVIGANSINVSKLTGTIPGDNNWSIDLDTGALNLGTVTASMISVSDLYALNATIAGWRISSAAIYKDVVDPNDSNTVYRVYFQPPLSNAPDSTWVLSCQKSTNGGSTFGGRFILYSDGKASFGNGTTVIDSTGRVTITGNDSSNPFLKLKESASSTYYASISPSNYYFKTSTHEVVLNDAGLYSTYSSSNTIDWRISRLGISLSGGWGGNYIPFEVNAVLGKMILKRRDGTTSLSINWLTSGSEEVELAPVVVSTW